MGKNHIQHITKDRERLLEYIQLCHSRYLAGNFVHTELVIARFIWAMYPRTGKSTPLPLLTEDIIWTIPESLKIVELGIVEVSQNCSV
jgi:hypothetical protein